MQGGRQSGFKDKLVSVSDNDSFGSTVMSPSVPIGMLCDHANIENTYHGSRILMGSTTVNQSLSLSSKLFIELLGIHIQYNNIYSFHLYAIHILPSILLNHTFVLRSVAHEAMTIPSEVIVLITAFTTDDSIRIC